MSVESSMKLSLRYDAVGSSELVVVVTGPSPAENEDLLSGIGMRSRDGRASQYKYKAGALKERKREIDLSLCSEFHINSCSARPQVVLLGERRKRHAKPANRPNTCFLGYREYGYIKGEKG